MSTAHPLALLLGFCRSTQQPECQLFIRLMTMSGEWLAYHLATLADPPLTSSTDSTQPYLPGEGASHVDPWLVAGYYAGMPDIPDVRRLRPRPVDEATRRANPTFYNPQRVNNAQTFQYDMLRADEKTGQRLSSLFRKPNEKKVGFHGPPISDTSDGVSKDSRYFYTDEKPKDQYTLRSTQPAHSAGSYAPGKSIRSPRDSPASRYADSGRARSPRPSNEYHSDNPQYGYRQPGSTNEATPSWPTSHRDSYYEDEGQKRRPKQTRRQSKQLYRRKSPVLDRTDYHPPASQRTALGLVTRSRQNSAAGLYTKYGKAKSDAPETYKSPNPGPYISYAPKPAKNEDYPKARVSN
jgi:hypothetical protein